MKTFAKPNNDLKIINNNCVCAYLCFKNIKSTKSLKLLSVKKLFTIYLFEILQHFFVMLTKIEHQCFIKMDQIEINNHKLLL